MLEFPSVCSPTGGCQRGDGAYQTKPSIRFPSCKAQCNIVSCILQENTRWLWGKGDPLTGVTNKPVLSTRGWVGGGVEGSARVLAQAHVIPPLHPKECRLGGKRELSAACHRIVMSHSIRAPGPIQFKICQRTPAKGFGKKMFSWLRDIINNSKLLMSSSLQHSFEYLCIHNQKK